MNESRCPSLGMCNVIGCAEIVVCHRNVRRICVTCKKPFVPTGQLQSTCSDSCESRYLSRINYY